MFGLKIVSSIRVGYNAAMKFIQKIIQQEGAYGIGTYERSKARTIQSLVILIIIGTILFAGSASLFVLGWPMIIVGSSLVFLEISIWIYDNRMFVRLIGLVTLMLWAVPALSINLYPAVSKSMIEEFDGFLATAQVV
jgi:hypothetical protein